jgi:LysR family transcriptional regulator, chromosome initiation inhibitor
MLPSKSCEAFLAVAELGSFEAAALHLNLSASAVTLRVQALEKQLSQVLLVRERPCRVTSSGLHLLRHLQQQRLHEQQLLQHIQGSRQHQTFQEFHIASNADSLATWLLPLLQPVLLEHRMILKLRLDDQSQTHQLLENGLVSACISTEKTAMQGCTAAYLGDMTYKMVASPDFVARYLQQPLNRESLKHIPAVIFDAKDHLHHQMILKLFGLQQNQYPHYFVPSSTAFVDAIHLGLGFGLVPEYQIGTDLQTGKLIEILPEAQTAMSLYWHHWQQQAAALNSITAHLLKHAQAHMQGQQKSP